jgi:hypothetical protein
MRNILPRKSKWRKQVSVQFVYFQGAVQIYFYFLYNVRTHARELLGILLYFTNRIYSPNCSPFNPIITPLFSHANIQYNLDNLTYMGQMYRWIAENNGLLKKFGTNLLNCTAQHRSFRLWLTFNIIYYHLFISHRQMCTVNFCPLIQYLGLHLFFYKKVNSFPSFVSKCFFYDFLAIFSVWGCLQLARWFFSVHL